MVQVQGDHRSFHARVRCSRPDQVWWLWVTPSTWGDWDQGLLSAEVAGDFVVGATGTITGLDGRRSRFAVDVVEPGRQVVWHVSLPGARMQLTRLHEDGDAEHRVQFRGPLAAVWAAVLGRRFKPLLGPTMDALLAAAHAGHLDGTDRA